jgi:hypothetical protein
LYDITRYVVVEEKVAGANAALIFSLDGQMFLRVFITPNQSKQEMRSHPYHSYASLR